MFLSLGAEARVVTEVKVDAPRQGYIVLEGEGLGRNPLPPAQCQGVAAVLVGGSDASCLADLRRPVTRS